MHGALFPRKNRIYWEIRQIAWERYITFPRLSSSYVLEEIHWTWCQTLTLMRSDMWEIIIFFASSLRRVFTKVWSLGQQWLNKSRFWSHCTVVKINIPPGGYIYPRMKIINIDHFSENRRIFDQLVRVYTKIAKLHGKFKVRKHKVWAKPNSHSVAWIPAPS